MKKQIDVSRTIVTSKMELFVAIVALSCLTKDSIVGLNGNPIFASGIL